MKNIKLLFVIGILANSSVWFTACTDQEQQETEALYFETSIQQATDDTDAEVDKDKGDDVRDEETPPVPPQPGPPSAPVLD